MKKIFGTLAMALCLTAMVSCGGDKKVDVAAKAKDYQKKIEAASEKGDYEKAEKIANEYYEWLEGLSEADQEKAWKSSMYY